MDSHDSVLSLHFFNLNRSSLVYQFMVERPIQWHDCFDGLQNYPYKTSVDCFLHIAGKAQPWYHHLRRNPSSWTELKHHICLHFGPNVYMDFCGELTRLQQ